MRASPVVAELVVHVLGDLGLAGGELGLLATRAPVRASFLHRGAECSAAVRVLVHEAVLDGLVKRLAGAVSVLEVGQASDLEIDVPPVIEQEAAERVARYATVAEREGRSAAVAGEVPDGGWFVAPTVATELPKDSAVLTEEILGPLPVVARRVRRGGLRQRRRLVLRPDRRPVRLQRGHGRRRRHHSPVGNLHVSCEITGAMVGRQSFDGNHLSGTGTKAGGPG